MELQYKDFNFVTVYSLSFVSSKAGMENNGWVFDGKKAADGKEGSCGTASWHGDCGAGSWYCSGSKIGSISMKFKYSGNATLDFGNCYRNGKVVVRLNGDTTGEVEANVKSKTINFEFGKGDELKISEEGTGIIKLNSFKVQGEKLNVYCIILSRRILSI